MDAALQATILDWFQFREVCDDDKFPVFFTRVLKRDMTRYNQLLRIEPGISDYDWLVQNYKERKAEIDRSIRGSKGESFSLDRTVANATTDTKTTTYNTLEQDSEQKSKNVANSGSVTAVTDYGKRTEVDDDKTMNGTTKNTGTVSNAGSETSNSSGSSDSKTMAKAAPQSIEYAGASGGMPDNFNWQYSSSQGETKNVGSDSASSNSTNTRTDDTTATMNSTENRDFAEQLSGSDTTTTTDTTAQSQTDVNSGSSSKTGTTTDTSTKGGSVNTDEESSRHITDSTSEDTTNKEQETGRNVDIATLLSNAKRFIITTNAWEWLANQLEVCFFGIYD